MTRKAQIRRVKKYAPGELRSLRQWVNWREEARSGSSKPEKVPYAPGGWKKAQVNNPSTWGSFRDALQGWKSDLDGIGFVLTSESRFVCVDLDRCCGRESGEISPWAMKIVKKLNSYTESSPSGRGLHIWVKAKLQGCGRRKGTIEIYGAARYITVTGRHLEGTPRRIKCRSKTLPEFYTQIFGERTTVKNTTPSVSPSLVKTPKVLAGRVLDVLLKEIKTAEGKKFKSDRKGFGRGSKVFWQLPTNTA